MPKNNSSINNSLFDLLKGKGYSPTMLSTAGKEIPTPDEAEVFQFNFVKDGEDYGKVTLSIDDSSNLIVYYSDDVADSEKGNGSTYDWDNFIDNIKDFKKSKKTSKLKEDEEAEGGELSWYGLLNQLKRFAQRYQLSFELRNTDNLKSDMAKRDYMKKQDQIAESKHQRMAEGSQQLRKPKQLPQGSDFATARRKERLALGDRMDEEGVAENSKNQESELKSYILRKQRVLDGGNSLSAGERRQLAQAKRDLKGFKNKTVKHGNDVFSGQGSTKTCPNCASADIKQYSSGDMQCNRCNASWEPKKGVVEGLEPEKRQRLDDLIDQYRDATDPSNDGYGVDDHYDPDQVIELIRQEFGDKVANEVEAGLDKMHFPRQHHSSGYGDSMRWKDPIDRITKAGKMYKQDSDYRKNTLKSRLRNAGKVLEQGVAEAAKWRSDPDAYDVDDEGNKTPRNPNSPKFGYDPLQRRADTANDAKTPRGKTAALKTSLKMAKGNQGVAEGNQQVSEGYYPMGKQGSYSDAVPTTKIIIQHSRRIEEGEQRYRNIAKIFVENSEGERFAVPTNKPGLARVYARHIAEGGTPYDERGRHITSLVEEYSKMSGFMRATRGKQFNESAQQLVTEAVNYYQSLRESLSKMTGHRGYSAYFESWTPALMEDGEEQETNLNELFVQETLDPRIESVMPILGKLQRKLGNIKQVDELAEWADNIIEGDGGQEALNPQGIPEATDVTDDNPKSQGGTRAELLRKYANTKKPKDAEAARRAGASQSELKAAADSTEEIHEGASSQDLQNAILYRVEMRYPELFSKYGHEYVADKALDVASFYAGAEEIGSSDISAMVNHLVDTLKREAEHGLDENLDADQVSAGQLGPTEKVGPQGAVGKLVGANESVNESEDELARILQMVKHKR